MPSVPSGSTARVTRPQHDGTTRGLAPVWDAVAVSQSDAQGDLGQSWCATGGLVWWGGGRAGRAAAAREPAGRPPGPAGLRLPVVRAARLGAPRGAGPAPFG